MVTKEQWLKAQEEERKFHNHDFKDGKEHYRKSYEQYFKYVGIDPDLKGKRIVEIGCADFPALAYCTNLGDCMVIEPMPSEHLKRAGIKICTDLAEDAEYEADEVWLFNVLQHVISPNKIVERAKKQAKIVRYFEPIEYGTDQCHLHNLTFGDFQTWFKNPNYYPPNINAVDFHTWECAYGVYEAI